ncbi:MAG: diguanylate cyclase [Zetaproteobacteria bacterium]|nr:diguanylate cyclase [Zetaproteobacteria bacterium]
MNREQQSKNSKETLKILAYDSDSATGDYYKKCLTAAHIYGKEVILQHVNEHEDALDKIVTQSPDIVILGLNAKDRKSLGICRYIRTHAHSNGYTGVLFVTDELEPSLKIQALKLGADDCCSKEQTTEELRAHIYGVARIKNLIDTIQANNRRIRAQNLKLSKIVITDELTQLNNMPYFWKRLRQEFARADRYQKNLSIIMMDLDRFKKINDGNDHLLGSFVIAKVGKLISENIRFLDIAARYGGDEYVILLPETNLEGALATAERIRQAVDTHHFDNGVHQVKVTTSMGVATIKEHEQINYHSHEDIVRCADRFLYEAKEQGRNQVVSHHNTKLYKHQTIHHPPNRIDEDSTKKVLKKIK